MKSTRRYLLCAAGSSALAATTFAESWADADQLSWAAAYIRRVGDERAVIVSTADTSEAGANAFDPSLIASSISMASRVSVSGVSGIRPRWSQQQEYLRLFHGVLTNAVLGRLGDYEHGQVRVVIEQPETRDGTVHVATVVERTGTPPVQVTWAVSPEADNPRILDVIAEGISLRLTLRADYNAYLSTAWRQRRRIDRCFEGTGMRRLCRS